MVRNGWDADLVMDMDDKYRTSGCMINRQFDMEVVEPLRSGIGEVTPKF